MPGSQVTAESSCLPVSISLIQALAKLCPGDEGSAESLPQVAQGVSMEHEVTTCHFFGDSHLLISSLF